MYAMHEATESIGEFRKYNSITTAFFQVHWQTILFTMTSFIFFVPVSSCLARILGLASSIVHIIATLVEANIYKRYNRWG